MNSSFTTESTSAPAATTAPTERRFAPRFAFSAVADLQDSVSLTKITARVADISLSGCYVDVITVFQPGTAVKISIHHSGHSLETSGVIVYSLQGMGMGLTFASLTPAMETLLNQWIAEANGEVAPAAEMPEETQMIQKQPRVERLILGRLIGLMIRKQLLARHEGTELLDELLRQD